MAANSDWPFDDAPNTACFTTTFVLAGLPILTVHHDYDGAWQFHGPEEPVPGDDDIKLVALKEIVGLDPSVTGLHDLQYGWSADRPSPQAPWRRFKNTLFPSFDEDGFFLEDAVCLAESRTDLNPPGDDELDELQPDDFVKLIFRFAAEDAERADGQCERMWVRVLQQNEDGTYLGMIENEPHHTAAACGDQIHFHPRHVAEIATGD